MSEVLNSDEIEILERPRLGELLLNAGVITHDVLTQALAEQARTNRPLGRILVDEGYVPAHKIAMALADQHGQPVKTEYGFASGHAAPAAAAPAPAPPPAAMPAPAAAPAAPEPRVLVGPVEVYLPAEIVEVNGHRYAVAKLDSAIPSSDEIIAAYTQKTAE